MTENIKESDNYVKVTNKTTGEITETVGTTLIPQPEKVTIKFNRKQMRRIRALSKKTARSKKESYNNSAFYKFRN